jgi:hypothetical protein
MDYNDISFGYFFSFNYAFAVAFNSFYIGCYGYGTGFEGKPGSKYRINYNQTAGAVK